jgi:hypothetical protein
MKKLILAAFALTTAVSVFAQGSIILNNRILAAANSQTAHIWGPSATAPGLSLIGLGSNDSPAGTTPFGAASAMQMIGQGGATGQFGYRTTFATLIGALGLNQPESSLTPFAGGGVTTFRTGSSLGDIASITMTLGSKDGPWQDAAAGTFELVAWDNSSGLYPTWAQAEVAWKAGQIAAGRSGIFNVTAIGGTANPTAPFLTSAGTIAGLSFNLYNIPEPSSFALAGLGAAALLIFRRRK